MKLTKGQEMQMIRLLRGLTTEQLAEHIGVSAKTLHRYENDEYKFETAKILKCKIYHQENKYLLEDM